MPVAPELSKKDIKRVNNALTNTRNEHRDRCYFFMLLYSGMRVSEPLGLSIADVQNDDGTYKEYTTITKTKGLKAGRVYFPDSLHPYLDAYLKDRPSRFRSNQEHLFVSQRSKGKAMSVVNATRLIKQAFINAGLPTHSSHSCRRTFACLLRREHGIDLSVISSLLRHESIKTSQLYFAASTIEANEAVSKLKF